MIGDGDEWFAQGACRGADTSLWFPERGEPTAATKQFCKECEVRVECLNYALVNHIEHGWWGGESERSRRRLKKIRNLRSVA